MKGAPAGNALGAKGAQKTPELITPKPDAVVFDANAFGHGRLDLAALRRNAERLHRAGIEVWVPMVVLLEWASHSVADASDALTSWKRLRRAGYIGDDFPVDRGRDHLVGEMISLVSGLANVKVLEIGGDSATAAVVDQILGTGPGTSTKGVKTGAADSTWVRDVLNACGNDVSKVVFLSDNHKDILATTKAAGAGSPTVRSLNNLYQSLFRFDTAPSSMARLVATYMASLTAPLPDDYHDANVEPSIDLGSLEFVAGAFDPVDGFEQTDVSVATDPLLVAVVSIDLIDHDETQPSAASISFEALYLADLDVNGYVLDNDGAVQSEDRWLSSMLVRAQFVADIVDDEVASASTQGVPSLVMSPEERADDAADAQLMVWEFFAGLPGVDGDDLEIGSEHVLLRGLDGNVALVDTDEPYDEWDMEFTLLASSTTPIPEMTEDGDFVEWSDVDEHAVTTRAVITCRYDVGAYVSDGRESFHRRPPYELQSETPPAPHPYEAFARVWRHLLGV